MRTIGCMTMGLLLTAGACQRAEPAQAAAANGTTSAQQTVQESVKTSASIAAPRVVLVSDRVEGTGTSSATRDTAMFAGGCFWSMQRPFEHVPGVITTTVGYAGGHTTNPTYEEVNTRTTGHAETVLVEFDPSVVSYDKLLDVYWHNIDPVTKDRQFCDAGPDYRTIIFTHGTAQHASALASKVALDKSGHFKTPVVTEVVANAAFWRAEEYHQHYADRNPAAYDSYRRACGRDERLHELWGSAAAPYVPKP